MSSIQILQKIRYSPGGQTLGTTHSFTRDLQEAVENGTGLVKGLLISFLQVCFDCDFL